MLSFLEDPNIVGIRLIASFDSLPIATISRRLNGNFFEHVKKRLLDYLSDRRQFVTLGNTNSELIPVNSLMATLHKACGIN